MKLAGNTVVTARIAAIAFFALSDLSRTAVAEDEFPPPFEPPLADSGWTAKYNEMLFACYQGSMGACDSVASDQGMVFDTPIYNYAATCGGRLDIVAARRLSAQMLQNGIREGTCAYIFPGHE
jgi:hypothetical protein